MVAKNDVTGDTIQTKVNSDLYRQNYDNVFKLDPNKKKRNDKFIKEWDEKVVMRDEYFESGE